MTEQEVIDSINKRFDVVMKYQDRLFDVHIKLIENLQDMCRLAALTGDHSVPSSAVIEAMKGSLKAMQDEQAAFKKASGLE